MIKIFGNETAAENPTLKLTMGEFFVSPEERQSPTNNIANMLSEGNYSL
jgi:hypothetical protein